MRCCDSGPASRSGSRACNGTSKLKRSMWSWPGTGIILMSLMTTCLSGLFLVVGARGPAYGKTIGSQGALTVSRAATITFLLAKPIESTTAVLVAAMVGQVLARKA